MNALLEPPVVTDDSVPSETPDVPQGTDTPAVPKAKRPSADDKPPADPIDADTARLFTDRFLNATRAHKPKASKEPKAEPAPAPAPPAEQREEPKPDPAPKANKEAKADTIDYDRLGQAVGNAVREATAKPEPAKKSAEAPAESAPALPDRERRKLEFLRVMETASPEKYRGVAERYADGLAKTAAYETRWKAEHPGESFDKADAQHDAFFETVAVDWDDDDYTEAVAEAKAQARTRELQTELEQRERRAEMEPKARQVGAEAARNLMTELGGEAAAAAIKPDGTLDEERFTALAESEPAKAEVLKRTATATATISTEIERLFTGAAHYDPANPLHKDISNFALKAEQAMLQQPKEQQQQDGKSFVPAGKFHAMSAAERARHWTFTASDLRYLAVQDLKSGAEKLIAEQEQAFAKWAEKRGMAANSPSKPAQEAAKTPAKPQSPAATVEPKTAGVKGQAGSKQEQAMSAWEARFIGRKVPA